MANPPTAQATGSIVIDTHTLIWYVQDPSKLSAVAAAVLAAAEKSLSPVFVSAITVVELRYLVEKKTIAEAGYQGLMVKLIDPLNVLQSISLDLSTAEVMAQIPRATVPDMPDRIIAATALALGLPLVSRDTNIRKLTNISIIW